MNRFINGVSDVRAARLAKQAHRELAQWQREDTERFVAVTNALAQSDAIPPYMKAIYAQTICSHNTPPLRKGELP
ncbi:hypothetical protein [Mycobacterium kansasii]|uniref:hypothetical protein n=1 Tax=Mycobacterium kansasii TaxID=1768 RepID=UPI001159D95F|nr:hypothetical protein [Mycobacterium kansasii]